MRLLSRRSIRVRLTLWYVALLALTLAAFSAGVYLALRQSLNNGLDDSLRSRAAIISEVVTSSGALKLEGIEIAGDPIEGEEFARVYGVEGELLFDNSPTAFRTEPEAAAVRRALAGSQGFHRARAPDLSLKVLVSPIRLNGEIAGVIEVGLTDEDVSETLESLLLIIAISYPLALAVTSAGGIFLAGRALGPIDQVTRLAQRIGAEDLSQRLSLDLPDDEVGRLARTFDEMIARLDAAFQRQRQFTADASHELRTPLTAVKGQTEVALQRERSPAEYREVLNRVNTEVDRMIRLVGSLLTLARADAASIPLSKERMRLDGVVKNALDSVAAVAQEAGVEFSFEGEESVEISADQDLLLQLLLNLLDNAIKNTPSGGTVGVSWRRLNGETEVAVSDSGGGIPPEALPQVFERFFRVDTARSRSKGGAGLGLSICKWIAEAHGGAISAESRVGEGSVFRFRLPAQ